MGLVIITNCQAEYSKYEIEVTQVNPVTITYKKHPQPSDEAMYQACQEWNLTAEQVREFFMLSKHYKESPYNLFYQLPCSITGELQLEDQTWQFTIDAGATGKWQNTNTVLYFGCTDNNCEPLVLMMPDNMNP
ncbi:hypothetical protein [Entomomonas asaccharolytica]|uniref:Uncharacterized protein n=1 Tax=Entomomonas asaccharolytica TaxID=2785331 RepID=A0A974RXQ7_9GAMM|nr:hypothetical protein [Entomomonas asaccharolytica]QQP86435.1 hypothetical protein JHT90_04135 [Entomomonas asaccharolytica]